MRKRFDIKTGKWTIDGKPCKEPASFTGQENSDKLETYKRGWPIYSDAAGCHPSQIDEHRAFDTLHGVPTDYDGSGRPILRDRVHRKKYLRAHGLHDRDAGYGD